MCIRDRGYTVDSFECKQTKLNVLEPVKGITSLANKCNSLDIYTQLIKIYIINQKRAQILLFDFVTRHQLIQT